MSEEISESDGSATHPASGVFFGVEDLVTINLVSHLSDLSGWAFSSVFFLFCRLLCSRYVRGNGRYGTSVHGSDFPGYDRSTDSRSGCRRFRSGYRQRILPSGPTDRLSCFGNFNRFQQLVYLCRSVDYFGHHVATRSARDGASVTRHGREDIIRPIASGNGLVYFVLPRFLRVFRFAIEGRVTVDL